MSNDLERIAREERAKRLLEARRAADLTSAQKAADKFGWNVNNVKAHESGRNGFGMTDAKQYARAYKVSVAWLYLGEGQPTDAFEETVDIVPVPQISWVSAGALAQPEVSVEREDYPIIMEPGLDPEGDWIALRVDGDSMNRISPHDSVIFVNRKERRPIPNACYIIGDGEGGVTYKRYRPPNRWEPVSTNPSHEPFVVPEGQEPDIIGRVRKTVLTM